MKARHANPEIDGARLRELRKLSGMSITEAARKIGITDGYLSQVERGTRQAVSPAVFGRICDLMEIHDRASLLRPDRSAA